MTTGIYDRVIKDPNKIFFSKVKKTETCWIYSNTSDPKSKHRVFSVNGKQIGAHRFSYEMFKGKIPKGLFVCHSCDNPPCVNPDHLFLGTQKENMADMREKERSAKGSNHSQAKLKEDNVTRIKILISYKIPFKDIAKMFKVSESCIKHISQGNSWSWLN